MKKKGIKTLGTCVELRYYDEETLAGNLVVEYLSESDQKYTIVSDTGSAFNDKYLDKAITVYYDRNNPAKAIIKGEIKIAKILSFLLYLIIFFIGLLFIIAHVFS